MAQIKTENPKQSLALVNLAVLSVTRALSLRTEQFSVFRDVLRGWQGSDKMVVQALPLSPSVVHLFRWPQCCRCANYEMQMHHSECLTQQLSFSFIAFCHPRLAHNARTYTHHIISMCCAWYFVGFVTFSYIHASGFHILFYWPCFMTPTKIFPRENRK